MNCIDWLFMNLLHPLDCTSFLDFTFLFLLCVWIRIILKDFFGVLRYVFGGPSSFGLFC